MTDELGYGAEKRRQGNLDILAGKVTFRCVRMLRMVWLPVPCEEWARGWDMVSSLHRSGAGGIDVRLPVFGWALNLRYARDGVLTRWSLNKGCLYRRYQYDCSRKATFASL